MAQMNFGIIAGIDWNSNQWRGLPTDEDLRNSNFGYVKENSVTYTCLNFGHLIYPSDVDGYYYGLLPQLWTKTPDKEKSKHVKVVFMRSLNHHDGNNYLVGMYAFPKFVKERRPSPIPEFDAEFEVNIRSFPKDVHLFGTPVNLSNHPDFKRFIPSDKELGKQGYNYMTKANVLKVLDSLTVLNREDTRLHGIKYRLVTAINRVH